MFFQTGELRAGTALLGWTLLTLGFPGELIRDKIDGVFISVFIAAATLTWRLHEASVAAWAPESKRSVAISRHLCVSWLGVERLHITAVAEMKIRKGVWCLPIWSRIRQKTRSCDPTPSPRRTSECVKSEFFWHSRGWKNDSSPGGERRKHSRPKQPGRNSPNAAECRVVIGQKEEGEALRDGESHAANQVKQLLTK